MIEQFKFYILPSLITFIGMMFIQYKILNKDINFKNCRFYIGLILFLGLNVTTYVYVTGFIRFVINTIIIILTAYIIYNYSINKIFVAVILEQVIYFFAELIVSLILLMFNMDLYALLEKLFSNCLFNISISAIAILLYYIPFVKKSINKILISISDFTGIKKYIVIFIFFITLNVLIMFIYSNNKETIFVNVIFILIYSVIIYFLINEKSENIKFKKENEILLTNLNEYEKMLDYQRVNNHENKNQLLVIRSMINKSNKKALEYLDEVITEKRKDDEGLYTFAKIIPEGGLQGLVYQKMLKMKENDIKINLSVDKKIRKVNFDNVSSKTNYDLCRIVGIILDNAIEEVIKLEDKEVLISMYQDNNEFIIEVSNKCKTIPDLSRLDEKRYTTKTKGHGYGLYLLKEIVSKNDSFENERSLNKDIFTQIVKIKM